MMQAQRYQSWRSNRRRAALLSAMPLFSLTAGGIGRFLIPSGKARLMRS
jgi:hypothetical protein